MQELILKTIMVIIFVSILLMLNAIAFNRTKPIEGDLNHDNQLTIVDLSILAERIRNQ